MTSLYVDLENLCRRAAIVLLGVMLFGCEDSTQPEPDPEPPKHPEQATSNELLVREILDDDAVPFVVTVSRRRDSGYFFCGFRREEGGSGPWVTMAGVLDSNGRTAWSVEPDYNVRGIAPLPGDTGIAPNGIIAVGSKDTDGDESDDVSVVTATDESGTVLDQVEWSIANAALSLRGATVVGLSDSRVELLAVGRQRVANVSQPAVATLTLSADSTLQLGELQVFSEDDVVFERVVADTSGATSGYFVQGNRFSGDSVQNPVLGHVSETLQLVWLEDLVAIPGLISHVDRGALAVNSQAVFVAGSTEVERTTSGGAHWRGGVVWSFSKTGTFSWKKIVEHSRWSNLFTSCRVEQNVVYMTGQYGTFLDTPTKRLFGYAWIYGLDVDTRELVTDHTFGSNQHLWRFNTGVMGAASSSAFGYQQRSSEERSASLFVELDLGWSEPARYSQAIQELPMAARVMPPPVKDQYFLTP
jgi:ketosteroid isomerase-like protein